MGNFAFLWFLSDISATRGRIHTKLCVRTMSADVALPFLGSIGPWGARGEKVNIQKNGGWSHSCSGQLPFLFFQMWFNMYGRDLRTF